LHAIVTEALKLFRPSLPATIKLREAILTESDTVLADPVQLHQVLIILFTDAECAMREGGGLLEVRLEEVSVIPGKEEIHPSLEPPAYVRLTVRHTGAGTPATVEESLVEPACPNAVSAGTGLSVAKHIVASHGGTILVDRTLQQGACVEVYLPRIEPNLPAEAVTRASTPRGTERILFVEDEEALAQLGREMLEDLGYETVVRTDPNEALRAFLTVPQRFDLVITDQTMPQMTGDMLAKEILRVRPDVPIVLLTGFSHVMDWEKAKTLGIRAYMEKPLCQQDLAVRIRQLLDGKNQDWRGEAQKPGIKQTRQETLTPQP
jgi:CheY-like chemotaxis protein